MASGRTSQHSALALEIRCRECGLPILVVAGKDGPEIADRLEFLAVHRTCLVASVPEQRPAGWISPR